MEYLQLIGITPEEFKNQIREEMEELLSSHLKQQNSTELLTRSEAADILKIDLSTLWRWVKDGKLQSYGLAGRVYFKLEDIQNAIVKL